MDRNKKVHMLLADYNPATHRGIARAALSLGWHLNVGMLTHFQLSAKWKCDGIICTLNDNKQLEHLVTHAEVPCVDLSAWRTDLGFFRITADDERIGQLAAEHFCANGHSSFGYFCQQKNPVSEARFISFKKELLKQKKPPPAQLTGKKSQYQQAIIDWLIGLKKPCALFAYNDIDAALLLNCCTEGGFRVPNDFSILGVDNYRLICEHQSTPLSSINHDHERIGYKGAQLLDRIMRGQTPPAKQQQTIPPAGITIRASSNALATRDTFVLEAVSYMTKHLGSSIGTLEIAEELGICRRNLELRFQAALKCSVHKKLIELRLKKAESLLCNTDEKIEHIAAVTGFCHAPHLWRVFKNAFGQTPQAYRKTHRERLENL